MRHISFIPLVLRTAAVATFAIGAGTLLFPELVVHWFDGTGGPSQHMVRFIGTALIGFSVTNWIYSSQPALALPAIYGNLTSLVTAIIVDSIGLIEGTLSRMAWMILLVHIVFASAFLYCIAIIKRHQAEQQR